MLAAQKLRDSITLRDGRRLATLADVHQLMSELSDNRHADPHWRLTETMLASADDNPSRAALRSLHELLCRALAWERLI
jgi:hypothetical protein